MVADPSPAAEYTAPPPADCSIVDASEAANILGYEVETPDDASKTGGICFYVSRNASEDGTLTYSVVTPDWLPLRRAFYRRTARRCAPAVKGTLNELACRQFVALASAEDMNAYYGAHAAAGDAKPVPGFGDEAVQSGNALYVHRASEVFEVSVLRGGDFDLDRTSRLARELLDRIK